MPTALDNGQRSPRKLLAAIVQRVLSRSAGNEREAFHLPLIPPSYLFMNPTIQLSTSGMSTRDE
jgi:hypothetical protein